MKPSFSVLRAVNTPTPDLWLVPVQMRRVLFSSDVVTDKPPVCRFLWAALCGTLQPFSRFEIKTLWQQMKLRLLGLFQTTPLPFMTHLCFNNSLLAPVFDLPRLLLALRGVQNHVRNTSGAILWSSELKAMSVTLPHVCVSLMCGDWVCSCQQTIDWRLQWFTQSWLDSAQLGLG